LLPGIGAMTFHFTTERLHIRPWLQTDRGALVRMTGDAEMMRYLSNASPGRTRVSMSWPGGSRRIWRATKSASARSSGATAAR